MFCALCSRYHHSCVCVYVCGWWWGTRAVQLAAERFMWLFAVSTVSAVAVAIADRMVGMIIKRHPNDNASNKLAIYDSGDELQMISPPVYYLFTFSSQFSTSPLFLFFSNCFSTYHFYYSLHCLGHTHLTMCVAFRSTSSSFRPTAESPNVFTSRARHHLRQSLMKTEHRTHKVDRRGRWNLADKFHFIQECANSKYHFNWKYNISVLKNWLNAHNLHLIGIYVCV